MICMASYETIKGFEKNHRVGFIIWKTWSIGYIHKGVEALLDDWIRSCEGNDK